MKNLEHLAESRKAEAAVAARVARLESTVERQLGRGRQGTSEGKSVSPIRVLILVGN